MVISDTGRHAEYWRSEVRDQHEISCLRGRNVCLESRVSGEEKLTISHAAICKVSSVVL